MIKKQNYKPLFLQTVRFLKTATRSQIVNKTLLNRSANLLTQTYQC